MDRRTLQGLAWLAALCLAAPAAHAAPPFDALELDGDAEDGTAAGDDWQQVLDGTSAMPVKVSLTDGTPDRTFAGAGSRDTSDLSRWRHQAASPAAADLRRAFAAATAAGDGLGLYFGADSLAATPPALGAWFFRRPVGLKPDGTFSGAHTVGDLLVLAGSDPRTGKEGIRVYRWVGAGGSDGVLDLLASGPRCAAATAGDTACAQAGGAPGTTLVEGGLALSALLPERDRCFASVLVTTRASGALDAPLLDFALGAFNTCSVAIERKATPELSTPLVSGHESNGVWIETSITNTGAVPLYLEDAYDDFSDILFFLRVEDCEFLAPGAFCDFAFEFLPSLSWPDPIEAYLRVVYNTTPELDGESCRTEHIQVINLFYAALDVAKSGPAYTLVGDTIQYQFTITNTSTYDTPPLLASGAVDRGIGWPGLGEIDAPQCQDLAPETSEDAGDGESCTVVTSYTVQPGDPDPLVNEVEVNFEGAEGFPDAFLFADGTDRHSVDILHPSYTLAAECRTEPAAAGGTARFEVTVANTGDAPLLFVTNEAQIASFQLAPGAQTTLEVSRPATGPSATLDLQATASLPPAFGIARTFPGTAQATCTVVPGATRGAGFWKTHPELTCHVLEAHLGGALDLGWRQLAGCGDVLGALWANRARESDGDRRSRVCQARVQGSLQLVAALLNGGLPNGAVLPVDPATGLALTAATRAALAAGDVREILRLAALLAIYNGSAQGGAIVDGDGAAPGPADPKGARTAADLEAVDCG